MSFIGNSHSKNMNPSFGSLPPTFQDPMYINSSSWDVNLFSCFFSSSSKIGLVTKIIVSEIKIDFIN
jgi:hypothetical protein